MSEHEELTEYERAVMAGRAACTIGDRDRIKAKAARCAARELLREEIALLRTQRDDALALLGAARWQRELAAWQEQELPCEDKDKQLLHVTLGVAEEMGELAHAVLKRSQGIRGSDAEHIEAACDALGDVAIYSMQVATLLGVDWLSAVEREVRKVLKRRWHGEGVRDDA